MKRRPAHKIQKKKKFINRANKKTVYRILSIVSLFLVSLAFLGSLSVYKRLTKSFTSALNSGSESYSTVSDRYPTLVFATVDDIKTDLLVITDLKYVIFDKNNKKVLVYKIPVEYKFEVAGKYGEEGISKVLALAALNSSDPFKDGPGILKNSILKIFGFKVDKFLISSKKSSYLFNDLLGNGSFLDLLRLKEFSELSGEFKTDLSLEEFYDLFTLVKSIPNDRLFTKELTAEDLSNPSTLDTILEDIGVDSFVSTESKSISILNGTNISGVASLGARVVKNMGGRVVALGNADRTYSTSIIVADDPDSETCKLLSRVFNIKNVVAKSENSIQEHEVDRSDIVVIMGFDTTEELY